MTVLISAVVVFSVSSCTPGTAEPTGSPLPGVTTPADSTAQTGTVPSSTATTASSARSADRCQDSSDAGVDAPLATYGDGASAKLHFVGGAPPTARLCGSFGVKSVGGSQSGSGGSTTGSLAYLFSLVQDRLVSTGGSYYWLAGAVDSSAATVVLSLSENPLPVTVTLVPLVHGWKGFAFLYSPGPGYYAPSSRNTRGPQNAGLTVTAKNSAGKIVDSRYINLDNNTQREVTTRSTR
ncbi:hypothetical protein ABLG96_08145 [Nakamurella sp. A5-74]|uniref:LppP/LprE family lipoprotein n=1 Tax=Nakamurella sp. A5-74 TaxID=3158264 RepID=A0AAU8DWM5_9ACTN